MRWMLGVLTGLLMLAQATAAPTLSVSVTTATPGAMVTATLSGTTTGSTPWIALYALDGTILDWDYVMAGVSSTAWTANMPGPGVYVFGYHDDSGLAVASVEVMVRLASTGNRWILEHFVNVPTWTGHFVGVIDIVYPALIKDSSCVGGWYCFSVSGQDPYTLLPAQASTDKRLAVVNATIGKGWVDGIYGASLITKETREPAMDVYMSNVAVAPDWPAWAGYDQTNMDGLTFDMGWQSGHVYLEDVAISGWADAAIDVKPAFLQVVRLHTEGSGYNTIKLWRPGPHYIVDSTINNERYRNDTTPAGDDGALIWSLDCSTLVLNIYNSTFNGSARIPANGVACGSPGTPTIHYLTHDPRTTGEMHPMFND